MSVLIGLLGAYEQWGLINAEKTAIAFPVAFPSSCFTISITAIYTNQAWSYPVVAQSITRSSFVARTQSNWRADDTARYIAVGYQQWGVVKGNGVSQTFPLAFATRCFAVAVTANIGSSRAVASSAWDVNKTSAIFYADITNAPSAGWYYAIGVQQWGVTGNNNVLFPVTFSQSCYIVNCNGSDWGSSGGATSAGISIQNITLQSFAVYTWERGPFRWLALGKQQWGATTSPSEDVTYPIPVSRVLCLLLTTRATTFRYSPWPTKITTKSFQAVSDREPVYWFLVAKQQWGTNQPLPITFPLRFASKCLTVVPQLQASGDSGNMSKNRVCVSNLTTNGFAIEYPQSTYNYIAIGV